MRRKGLIITLMLLSTGGIYAILPTGISWSSASPGRPSIVTLSTSDASELDYTALQTQHNAATDSADATKTAYSKYYASILTNTAYTEAGDELTNKVKQTQEEIKALTDALQRALKKAPHQYVLDNVDQWITEWYGTSNNADYTAAQHASIVEESDFTSLKETATTDLATWKDKEEQMPDSLVYGTPAKPDPDKTGSTIPGYTGIIMRCEEAVAEAASSFDSKKASLLALLTTIGSNEQYASIRNKTTYTLPKAWGDNFDKSQHNLTAVTLYEDFLRKEMAFVETLSIYWNSISEAKTTLDKYFTEADQQAATDEAYTTNKATIEAFETALQQATIDVTTGSYMFDGQTYASLNDLMTTVNARQQVLQSIESVLYVKLIETEDGLQEEINGTRQLLACLSDDSETATTLSEAINTAESTANSGSNYLSDYTTARSTLTAARQVADTYFNGICTDLETAIGTARQMNQTWNDSDLAAAITKTETVLTNARAYAASETSIDNAKDELETVFGQAQAAGRLKTRMDELTACIALYGDAGNTLTALLTEADNLLKQADRTTEAMTELETRIDQQLAFTAEAYEEAKQQLEAKIAAAQNYYNNWKDSKEGFEALAEAIADAQAALTKNTTETNRNIAGLLAAFTALDEVYEALGGSSDPFESQQKLLATIAEAEAAYGKYNYNDLLIAINEAKSQQNSSTKYILDQQITYLEQAMATAESQYAISVNRLDGQLTATRQKMEERYAENLPDEQAVLLKDIAEALTPSEETPGERACTDITLLQNYYVKLQDMAQAADDAWDETVNDFYDSILEAELKFQSNYADNETLGQAIEEAKDCYERISTDYTTIASVEALAQALDNALVQVEGNDRLNIANQFVRAYAAIRSQYDIYGSDENTANVNGAKKFLESNLALYEELKDTDAKNIHYSLTELADFVSEAETVAEEYAFFCKTAETLTATIATATAKRDSYYRQETDNALTRTIGYADRMLRESFCQDSIESANYALKDTLSVTERTYRNSITALQASISQARRMHTVYYGSATTDSEILTVCTEAAALLTDYYYLTGLSEMTTRVDECYAAAQAECEEKDALLVPLIDQAEVLNTLKPDDGLDNAIANAINARFSMDARIAAIERQTATLTAQYNKVKTDYEAACTELTRALAQAGTLPETLLTEEMTAAIGKAVGLLEQTDVTDPASSAYADIAAATAELNGLVAEISTAQEAALTAARQNLENAIEEAVAKHNYYYGKDVAESEILKVVAEAEPYRTDTDTEAIGLMTDSLTRSYIPASVKCARIEAELDVLIRRSTPLATVMEDSEYARMIPVATDCRNRTDGRITAIDSIYTPLNAVYEESCIKYDKATNELADSIATARELVIQYKDAALQTAIDNAVMALDGANKTSAAGTKYAELLLQTADLTREMERVRLLITQATGVGNVRADALEADLYNLQGHLLKRIRLDDPDALKGLPRGVYILNGEKVFIK